jgi:predicted O-linked N-acetylglucosamine transferase (SPINDLY family)
LSFQHSKYYQQVIDLINKSEFNKAKTILENNKNEYSKDFFFYTTFGYVNDILKEYNESEANYIRALELNNDFYDARFNLAVLYYRLKNYLKSENLFRELIKKNNKDYLSYYNLGLILFEKRDFLNSIITFRKVCDLNPKFWAAYHHLAQAYEEVKEYNSSVINYENAIKLAEGNAGLSFNNIGNVYSKMKKHNLAYKCFLKSLKYKLDKSLVYNNLATLLLEIGNVEKSILYFKKAVNFNSKNLKIQSRFIATSLYSKKHKDFYKEYIRIFSKHSNNFKKNTKNFFHNTNIKKLKVGFLSSDFKKHPIGYFLLDHLEKIKKNDLELHAYSNVDIKDNYTDSISKKFDYWTDVKEVSDEELILKIKNDNINILLDLSGHTGDNRINIFFSKPAPVQISWASYLASTGIKEINYILGDPYVTPIIDQNHYTEKIWQLKSIWCCLSVSDLNNLDLATETPALKNGYVTFGSFSNANKINQEVLITWSKILKNISNSILILKSFEFKQIEQTQRIKNFFSKNNIDLKRIVIEEPSERIDLLKTYNKIDIVLDTFPYSGGTTSFEASWMCVPLLTLKGSNFISKCGESINSNLNMKDWIARDTDDYINKCIFFSKNFKELDLVRDKLKLYSRSSVLFDSNKFSLEFADSLKEIWKVYLENR